MIKDGHAVIGVVYTGVSLLAGLAAVWLGIGAAGVLPRGAGARAEA